MTGKLFILAAALTLAAAPVRAQQPADGASVYTKNCASCHGVHGTPSPAMAHGMGIPDLAAASAATVSDSVLREVVLNGKGRTMPAYKTRLTPAQVEAVIAYIRTFSKR